ncbi:MAG: phosphotransferase [Rhodospirillales bacterium]|nr:phosphotransferase [Rhodospirillales bacterium]
MTDGPVEFLSLLRRAGLLENGETPTFEAMSGGVASDIWRTELVRGPVCVKKALPKLKVAEDWRAPVERNAYEAEWLEVVGNIIPGAAPKILARDADQGMFAMEYCNPERFPCWKDQLLEGHADAAFAAAVGEGLARIHSATAQNPKIAAKFPTDDIFYAIRLAPYLEYTATIHPDLADALNELVRVTAGTHTALVHGDVSPKNILVGPDGPVFLDAECAWYGDPAFDLAFCLNHLLLKCLAVPTKTDVFLDSFDALAQTYLHTITAEMPDIIEARAARLLPGLFLARVDGKSPVEYLTHEGDKDRVRRTASACLLDPVGRLADIRQRWRQELNGAET